MTSSLQLKQLNKLIQFTIFFILFIVGSAFAATVEDIWKKNENQNNEAAEINKEKKITIESPIVSDKIKKISIKIEEQSVGEFDQTVIGIFDPEINNFNLNMWSESDGEDVKKILKRINKLKLSKFSEDLMFKVLFTNAYSPKKNLTSEEFLKIKIDWLIKNKRLRDLETLLMLNPVAGKEKKVIKLLVNEYLSSSDIRSACEKMNSLSKDAQSDYLDKFLIYCLIHQDRKDEAQLILELLKERSFKDNFFDDKINFLLGLKENTSQKIKDDNLLNFYLSHITAKNFSYKPNEKTDKYIWRYLSSANLIKTTDFDNEEVILTYEKAAAENSIGSAEIFKIYKQILFSVDQLINAMEDVDEREFVSHMSKELGLDKKIIKRIWKNYDKVHPSLRYKWRPRQWEKWLNKQGITEDKKRDYKSEYKKFQSSTKAKKYRAELNQYNRKKGTYGNNDGKDASHKGGKIVGFEKESTNRGRREKSRLKKEDIREFSGEQGINVYLGGIVDAMRKAGLKAKTAKQMKHGFSKSRDKIGFFIEVEQRTFGKKEMYTLQVEIDKDGNLWYLSGPRDMKLGKWADTSKIVRMWKTLNKVRGFGQSGIFKKG